MIDIEEYLLAKFPGKRFNSAGNLHANCPFHDDSTKSFSITRSGMFICGSTKCGIRGNFAYFYKLSENITWRQVQDAIEVVTPRNNLDMTKLFVNEVDEPSYVINTWPPCTELIGQLDYLEKRGFSDQEVEELGTKFGLRYGVSGYHEGVDIKGTVVIPIYDVNGVYRTFQVRYLSEDKWTRWKNPLNSPLQDLLYGAWCIPQNENVVWVVEGASDVWNLARYGYTAVGMFTKESTYSQMNTLYEIGTQLNLHYIVCLDGDAHSQHTGYGKDYCAKLNAEIRAFGLPSSILYLDKYEDPGGLSEDRIQKLYAATMV